MLSRLLALPALLGLCLLASGAPVLAGCDSSGRFCVDTTPFSFEDISPEGTELGEVLQPNECVTVEYVGRLADGGGVFAQGDDLTFFFPNGLPTNVPRGFLLGMSSQRVGETRRIIVPPTVGYGYQEQPPLAEGLVTIPSCSTLEFEIRLKTIYQDARQCQ